ncbi:MAG: hypothetical protein QE263_02035 [Vampirovibrionales bacterium]|nr:hypothetical protein [Vampirovibrionales bacterium]
MSLEKDPANKEVVPQQTLDNSLASSIIKITFWPIVIFNIVAISIEYPWILGFTYDAFHNLKPWSTPIVFTTGFFTCYSFAKLIYVKKRNEKVGKGREILKITMDISIVSILVLLALIAITYNFFPKNW